MSPNLALFPFNRRANTAISGDGWTVEMGVVVDALGGHDTITGDAGITNSGTINTGLGNDSIASTAGFFVSIVNDGTINTGNGKDSITGTGGAFGGIINSGTIHTGNGNDTIRGDDAGGTIGGIINTGTINTGAGNDTIKSDGGISSYGTIDTGNGNDTITGDAGIINGGTIHTGNGNDKVDALKGGFQSALDSGFGEAYLGAGNDTLKGFGTGSFYGGTGKDKLLFGEGIYEISGSTAMSGGVTMNVYEFERIGGANGGLFHFQNGTLNVNAAGVGTFV